MYTLIVLTFLAGSVWGPQIEMSPIPNAQACEAARNATVANLVKMSKSNITMGGMEETKDGDETVLTGPSGREMARLICQSHQASAKASKTSKMATNEELRAMTLPQ